MLESIWEDLKREFSSGNMITRLILVNVSVYVFINLLWVISGIPSGGTDHSIYDEVTRYLSISSDPWFNLTHPWVLVTNMFLHQGFMHILFNMLFLYWFGRIVGDLIGDHRILPIYLLGGLTAGLVFFASANLLPYGDGAIHYALGASGSVMAIVVAAGVLAPEYIMRLLILGDIKLKYIVAALVFFDIVATGGTNNTGGAFGHLGGAAFGWLFVSQLRNGQDLSAPVNSMVTWFKDLFSGADKSRKPKKSNKKKTKFTIIKGEGSRDNTPPPQDHQEKLDKILEKIKKEGYENLTSEEKEFLFNASNK
ncbi:MAG: rhomboid family intramembrane serine protease [Saprospiraceae bacterium]|nr:rhomboid family intramembrane serine protease [Saprospiraceae bacterium]